MSIPGITTERVLLAAMRARVPALLWGKPGVGKTAVVEQLAAQLGQHCETLNASNRDATDYLGFLVDLGNGEAAYSTPPFARRCNQAKAAVLFLDEFNTCPMQVFAAQLRLVQERWAGDTKLADSVSIVAAANPPDIAVNGNELPPPMASRFLHLDWVFRRDVWLEHMASDFARVPAPDTATMLARNRDARRAQVSGWVTAYLAHNPAMLDPDVPKSFGAPIKPDTFAPCYAYPSPRAWHNLARVLAELRADDEASTLLAARGVVGEAAASTFNQWLRGASLYDPADVIAGNVRVEWDSAPDRIYALNQALTETAKRDGSIDMYQRVVDLLTECIQTRPDVAIVPLRHLLSTLPPQVVLPSAVRARIKELVVPAA